MNAEEEKDPEPALTPPMNRDIRFEHVSFTYDGSPKEAVSDVSFEIKAGTTVGFLGGTGSGKSTLMYLLEKLYPLKEGQGRITIGGIDLAQIKNSYARSQIGIVLQEPYLFSRSIYDNIAITSDKYRETEVRRAPGTHEEKGILLFPVYKTVRGQGGRSVTEAGLKAESPAADQFSRALSRISCAFPRIGGRIVSGTNRCPYPVPRSRFTLRVP